MQKHMQNLPSRKFIQKEVSTDEKNRCLQKWSKQCFCPFHDA